MNFRILFLVFLTLFLSLRSHTQPVFGSVIGKVLDDEGGPLPGVEVVIEGERITRMSTITNELGMYRFINVPAGEYSITVFLLGFATQRRDGVHLLPGKTINVEFELSIVTIEEEITIMAPTQEAEVDFNKKINKALKRLKPGKIMYNPPDKMKKDVTERIEVRITQDFQEDIIQGLVGRGIPHVEDIIVNTVMEVELTGDAFKILSLSEKEQIISPSGFTQWEWDVTPIVGGYQKLYLLVAVVVYLEEYGEKKKSFPVKKKVVFIEVDTVSDLLNWAKRNWYILLGALATLIGIITGIKKLFKKS